MTDVIEYMLHRPIHSCGIGQWAYTLFGYDLAYASLRSIRGQIIVDFVTEHRINVMHNINISLVSLVLWRLCFDGSTRSNGQSVGVVYIFLYGTIFEASCRLEYFCARLIKAEYALLFGLTLLLAIGAIHIEAFGDSL